MQLYSVIKNDCPGDALCWKFLGEDFNYGSQLIVAESEEALFFKDGIIEQIFAGGKYTLHTNNYPFITKLRSFFSGGVSAFNCRVYFINKAHKLELFWGTDTPIQMRDPVWNLQTNIRARGSYSIQVTESKKFLIKLVGNNIQLFTQDELNGFFRSAFLQYIKDKIPQVIKDSGREILDICTEKTTIADALAPKLNELLDEYGVRVVHFYISAIDIPENDPNRGILEKAFAKKAELGVLGSDWAKTQAADILRDLANNPGAGGFASAGAGIGLGFAAGNAFSTMADELFRSGGQTVLSQQPEQHQQSGKGSRFTQKSASGSTTKVECPTCKSQNEKDAKFCMECGTKLATETVTCENCKAAIPATAKFCNECGAKRE